jgi:hypothetical protein
MGIGQASASRTNSAVDRDVSEGSWRKASPALCLRLLHDGRRGTLEPGTGCSASLGIKWTLDYLMGVELFLVQRTRAAVSTTERFLSFIDETGTGRNNIGRT